MNPKIEKLQEEIESLEALMEKDHFGGLFDKGRQDKNYKKLKKLKRELQKLKDEDKKGNRATK